MNRRQPGPVLRPATAQEIHTAQILTGAAMAAWLACDVIPGIRPYVAKIRAVLLAAYLFGCAVFIAYVFLR